MKKNIREIGLRWERELAKRLKGKRQPSSGAFGTQIHDASLTGDITVKYPWLKMLHIEAKFGYGGSKSMSLKREWFEKVRAEAKLANRYPVVAIKFRDVTGGDIESAKVICINIDVWEKMMREISYLYAENLARIKEDYEREGDNGG